MKTVRKIAILLLLMSLFACSKKETAETAAPVQEEVSGEIIKVAIDIKDYGTVKAELYGDIAPKSVANFVALVKEGFYDGNRFHRIIDGFMMQVGDPQGNGQGGSGTNNVGEFANNGYDYDDISHIRGTISMARAQDNNSGSSQFFIMQADNLDLDGNYAAFGHVTSGMDIVDAICANTPVTDNNGTVLPDDQPVITEIRVID